MTDHHNEEEKAIYNAQYDFGNLNECIRQIQDHLAWLMKTLAKYDDKKEEQ